MSEAPRIFAAFRYRDPEAVMRWLCDVIGFKVVMRHPEEGRVEHAELSFGSAMVMLGGTRDDEYGKLVGEPGTQGGKSTYVVVHDPDELYRRVEKSGVAIEKGLTDQDYGSRDFLCRDPEGNLWCFGTYWPKTG